MNEEIKAKWISALLSGEYEQGKGFLRDREGKYCCLGVLCDLYSKDTGTEWGGNPGGSGSMHGLNGMTPDEVDLWAGFTSGAHGAEVRYGTYNTLTELAEMNDFGRTFEEIVEVIKERL